MTELKQTKASRTQGKDCEEQLVLAMAIPSEQGLFWQQALLTCLLLIDPTSSNPGLGFSSFCFRKANGV